MGYKMSGSSLYPNIKRSTTGYKINSDDKHEKELVITSNEISMKEDDGSPLERGPVMGTGLTTGNKKVMKPGETYTFKGDEEVLESPLANREGTQYIDGVLCDAYGTPIPPEKKWAANINENYKGPGSN
jgi:hypothetical protein